MCSVITGLHFSLLCRSLAYNNLETLPKDLFKGLEALTKV